MKKTLLFIFYILFFTIASAIPSINFQNEEIKAGETVLLTIATSGEFVSKIEKSQINFMEGRRGVSLEFDIT
jgi:hypothetical protein